MGKLPACPQFPSFPHSFEDCGDDADWSPESNQLAGMALCKFAAEMLGENAKEEPWS